MALTGTFLADFTSFQDAVQKSEASLRSFEGNANKVENSVTRMSNSLSGTSIVQQATIAARAVEEIGGVSKLTEAELRRVGATATEAASKLRAMGQDVPQGIQKIADAAKNLTPQLSMADKAAGFLKSTFAQFTAAALAAKAIQSATAAVGEFVSTGIKLPAMEQSFSRLTASMGQDGDLMLRNLQTTTRGLVSNYDLMASANKAMLLGLPVTSAAMGDLAKTATTLGRAMGLDATKSLNDLIVALGRSSPLILDNLGLTVKVGEANKAYADKLGKTVEQLTDVEKKTAFYEAAMEAARLKTEELGETTLTLGEMAASVWVSVGNAVSASVAEMNVGVGAQVQALTRLLDLRKQVTGQTAENTETEGRWYDSLKLSGLQLITTTVGLSGYNQSLELHARAAKESSEAQAVLNANLAAARKATPGLPTQPGIGPVADEQAMLAQVFGYKEITKASKSAGTQAKVTGDQFREFNKVLAAHEKIGKAYTKTMDSTDAALKKLTRGSNELNRELHDGATVWLMQQKAASSTAHVFGMELIPELRQGSLAMAGFGGWTKQFTLDLGALSQSLANLAQISAGSFGAVAQGLATVVGALDAAQKAQAQFSKGLEAFKGQSILAGIAGMATGIMGIVSAAVAAAKAIGAIWNAFDRNKGRDLVKDFAESFGGFDALHTQLLTLGDAGEQLWIKLTQGVGRNNPDQAARVIAEVEAALAKQAAAQDAATISTEAGAQATIETATHAAKALDELNGRLQTNADAWGAWSEDVTGYLQKLANDIRAMPLPGPTGTQSGTGTVSGGTLRGGGGGGTTTVNMVVDGEVVARAALKHAPGEFDMVGVS